MSLITFPLIPCPPYVPIVVTPPPRMGTSLIDAPYAASDQPRAVETHFKKPRFFRFLDFQVKIFTFSCQTL